MPDRCIDARQISPAFATWLVWRDRSIVSWLRRSRYFSDGRNYRRLPLNWDNAGDHRHWDNHEVIFSVDALTIHIRVTCSRVRVMVWIKGIWLTLRIAWSLSNNWASISFPKTCRLIHILAVFVVTEDLNVHSTVYNTWWLAVCVTDYETNCTKLAVLHVTNNWVGLFNTQHTGLTYVKLTYMLKS